MRFVLDQVSEYMVKVVRDAAKKLDSLGIGSLLVKKDGDYVGMVSETEITRQSVAKNLDPNNTKISDILNPDIDYID